MGTDQWWTLLLPMPQTMPDSKFKHFGASYEGVYIRSFINFLEFCCDFGVFFLKDALLGAWCFSDGLSRSGWCLNSNVQSR